MLDIVMNSLFATISCSLDKILRSRRLMRTPTMQRVKQALMVFFPDMPFMKGFTEINSRRYTCQQPETKSSCGPAD